MKLFAVLLAFPVLGLCQDLVFRKPPNCMGTEEAMPKQQKCVSTGQLCGGGSYVDGICVCGNGYMRAGQTGIICIPRCTGDTARCVAAGGTCDAVNFCNCGEGRTYRNGQCVSAVNDACGGKCNLGTCQSDGTCVCPADYQLNANKTNCEPVANCPYYSVKTLPNLCQCIGSSYYSSGECVNAPQPPQPDTTTTTVATTANATTTTTVETTTTTGFTTTTTSLDFSTSTSTPFFNATSTVSPDQCSCTDIQSVMRQILSELNRLESGI